MNNVTVNRVSYNGGAGGVAAVPTPQERTALLRSAYGADADAAAAHSRSVKKSAAGREGQRRSSCHRRHTAAGRVQRAGSGRREGRAAAVPVAANPAVGAHGNTNTGNRRPGAGIRWPATRRPADTGIRLARPLRQPQAVRRPAATATRRPHPPASRRCRLQPPNAGSSGAAVRPTRRRGRGREQRGQQTLSVAVTPAGAMVACMPRTGCGSWRGES